MRQYLKSNRPGVVHTVRQAPMVSGQVHGKTVRHAAIVFWSVLISGIVLFLLTTTLSAYQKNRRLEEHLIKLNHDDQILDCQNKQIQREITAIRDDPFYLEMVMRRELNMLQEGEIVIKPRKEITN